MDSIYQTVVVLADSKNYSQAAKKLYISQPALTKKIMRLEEELGCRLFDRGKNGVEMTPQGEIFVHHARKIVQEERDLHSEIENSLLPNDNFVRIVTSHRGGKYLTDCLASFEASYPEIKLIISDKPAVDDRVRIMV